MNTIKEVEVKKIENLQDENKLNKAAYVLSNEIGDIRESVSKASLLVADMLEDYFNRYSYGREDDHVSIAYEFKRNGTYCDIVCDYLFKISNDIKRLEKMAIEYTKPSELGSNKIAV